jgi:methyl-accepting chemotaxis protein
VEKVQVSQSGKDKKYIRIGLKIGAVVAVMQMVSVVLAMTICVNVFTSLVMGMLEQRCTNGTNMLAHELSRISENEDKNRLLDELKELMGCEFTIFEGDTRAYSTVTQNGERAVGTKLSSELNAIVLQKGQSYVGEADILGEKYLCSYVPTRGADGQINGLIFAGISEAEADEQTRSVIWLCTVVSGIVIAICVLIMAAYLRSCVSAPLKKITQVAQSMEKGELGLARGGMSM